MKPIFQISCMALAGVTILVSSANAEDSVPSAQDLAARLSANIQDNSSAVRLKMEISKAGGGNTVLQVQVKSRRTKASTDVFYQILWPKERKGEAFLLRKTGDRAATGSVFTPPDSLVSISGSKMKDGVFGSDLSYEDLVENFFGWKNQAIVGTETVDRVPCQILESKPGKGDHVTYPKVLSWIDVKRMVPLRVEKYLDNGKLARRIDTTRVVKDDTGRSVGASFTLQRPGQDSKTEIEGSNSRHDLSLPDSDFTTEALRALK
jgi:hypothetical protein